MQASLQNVSTCFFSLEKKSQLELLLIQRPYCSIGYGNLTYKSCKDLVITSSSNIWSTCIANFVESIQNNQNKSANQNSEMNCDVYRNTPNIILYSRFGIKNVLQL